MEYLEEYNRWMSLSDDNTKKELQNLSNEEIEDAFYKNLSFGTGGLRGIIGAGTNRMNPYTVGKASQGLSQYIKKHYAKKSIAISFDSRIKSEDFAKECASVFAANGIKVYLFTKLMPTPCLSFAVRFYGCSAGVMITASHNPSKYNGYKVYNEDGCQITTDAANEIFSEIEKIDIFNNIRKTDLEKGISSGLISYIGEDFLDFYLSNVKNESVIYDDDVNRDVTIVYSPLNGTGLIPVTRVLKESRFCNLVLVKEQELPNGNFPTCPYPNPEIKEAMELGMEYARKSNADLFLATDPDCDRVGIAVRNGDDYTLLTGNEVGILLTDFICSQKIKHHKMPKNPVLIKTIVTTNLSEKIAESYGVKTVNVLTGFKFIGEQIGFFEKKNEKQRFIFGFEESYGYLSGTYVRDKDAVIGCLLISEMFAYYKTRNISLMDRLMEIYEKFGYCKNSLYSFEFDGSAGMNKMNDLMNHFRKDGFVLSDKKIIKRTDYLKENGSLPKSNVLEFLYDDNSTAVVRPSGTEPKLKVYLSVYSDSDSMAEKTEKQMADQVKNVIENY